MFCWNIIPIKKIILLIALLGSTCLAQAQIEGETKDEQNKLIPDVHVTLTDGTGKTIASLSSSKKGFYTIDKLAPGKYQIKAIAPGFDSVTIKDIKIVNPPKNTDPYDDTYYAVCVDIILTRQKQKAKNNE